MANQFNNVAKLNPGRSVFDLSYEKKFTCDMGELIPVLADSVVPGDKWKIGNEIVLRFEPLVAPILHEVNVFVHYFFVPYRLLWNTTPGTDSWEAFLTGGPTGDLTPTHPIWTASAANTAKGKLWDYMGFPIGVTASAANGNAPSQFPKNAYNFIWNEYYRDQTLQTEVALTQEEILFRAWEKDYFTSALPWQQRGTPPALPIAGSTTAVWTVTPKIEYPTFSGSNNANMTHDTVNHVPGNSNTQATLSSGETTLSSINSNTVDLSTATSFDIADLRTVVQVQKFLERNARVGARYTEFLGAHFGVKPKDERLDRPEYIGGTKSPVIISEVLQTSATDLTGGTTAQGNLAGHGITADRTFAASYSVKEFGIIMGIMSVMPRTVYQQGIDRQWLRETRYDYYFPEFAHLSEQAILTKEIYLTDVIADNNTLFGYQGKYDEMRVKKNMVCSDMRDTFDYWHISRQFAAAPILDETFIRTGTPGTGTAIRKDIFAAPSVDGLKINFANKIMAIRPIPNASEPGMMDHF